MHVLQI